MSSDEPVILGIPRSIVDELAVFVRDGKVVLTKTARGVLSRGLSEIVPKDRQVELRVLENSDVETLRRLRDEAKGQGGSMPIDGPIGRAN
jgi:hypothetical protein